MACEMINVGFQCRPSQPIDLWSRPPFALLQSVSFFWGGGDRHQSSLSDKIEYFWCALCVCVCVPVVLQCGIKVCLGVRTMCVRVLGCWCCCWDYEGCSALVGMRGELLGHILGTPRR